MLDCSMSVYVDSNRMQNLYSLKTEFVDLMYGIENADSLNVLSTDGIHPGIDASSQFASIQCSDQDIGCL